jgi:anti-sigma regulatory factor (Ser/Thr protein kinase)
MEAPPTVVELSIRNDLAGIAAVRDRLDEIASETEIPFRVLMQLQVAMDEVLSNVVKYAWPDGGTHELRVRVTVRSDRVELDVYDDGRPYDPRATPLPEPPPEGTRRRPRGVGIHMVRQLVDRFEYERIDGCNHTTLIKACITGGTPQTGV